ncbi:MAG: PA14 domain-containing protein [Cyanobacteria bacterium P01_F01_bin.150]
MSLSENIAANSTETLFSSDTTTLGISHHDPLTPLVKQAQQQLMTFAASENALADLSSIYKTASSTSLEAVLENWVMGNFSQLPNIEVLTDQNMGGAVGAFSAETDTIYLAESVITPDLSGTSSTHMQRPDSLLGDSLLGAVSTIIEEVGHKLDSLVNSGNDTQGDEGALFKSVVFGEVLTAAETLAILNEDDRGMVVVNGQPIPVEQKKVKGDDTDNVIIGSAENDKFWGNGGDDQLVGNAGKDGLWGGTGNDQLDGGSENDRLYGDEGEDSLKGGAGNDKLLGGADADMLDGQAGRDRLKGDAGSDYLDGGEDSDRLSGGSDNDTLMGGAGSDRLFGEGGADLLDGGDHSDRLLGGDNADTLVGGKGNDYLDGGEGDDRLDGYGYGAEERDRLKGGSGADTFVLGSDTEVYYSQSGKKDVAIIEDLDIANDRIELPQLTNTLVSDTEGFGYTLVTKRNGNTEILGEGGDRIAVLKGVTDISLTDAVFGFGADLSDRLSVTVKPDVAEDGYVVEDILDVYDPTQNIASNLEVMFEDSGDTLHLKGNGWRKMPLPFTVTKNTVLKFDFKSTAEGEIQGIGLDQDDFMSPETNFKLFGGQAWGIDDFYDYSTNDLGEWKSYEIPVGEYFTGDMNYLTFVHDHDGGAKNAESWYRGIEIYNKPGITEADKLTIGVIPEGGDRYDVREALETYDPDQHAYSNLKTSIEDDGKTLHLQGNGWRKVDFPYIITENTVLKFDYKSTAIGEIQGIGFDTDSSISPETNFQLFGEQTWGIDDFRTYSTSDLGEWKSYEIPVGEYFTGPMNYLTFAHDHDGGLRNSESWFRNIEVSSEQPNLPPVIPSPPVIPVPPVAPPGPPIIPTPPKTTWNVQYFNNDNVVGTPAFSEIIESNPDKLEAFWAHQSPNPKVRTDNFSARFTTTRYFEPGLHKITTGADDGIRVSVNSERVIERWGFQPLRTDSGFFYSDGGTYPVVVDYQENKISAGLDVQFSKATPFEEASASSHQKWYAEVFHVDPWNPTTTQKPPTEFANQRDRLIGTIDLGSATRSDGNPGISFNTGTDALKGNGQQLPHDNFAVRAHTKAYFDGGTYKFKANGDDAFQLFAAELSSAQIPTGDWYDIANGGQQMSGNTPTTWEQSYGAKEYTVTLPQGWYGVHFSYSEAWGGAAFDLSWEKVTPWKAEYFNNKDLSGTPAFTETFGDGSKNFREVWGAGSPNAAVQSDNFSARFTTTRYFEPGLHKVRTQADDGIRVKVGGEMAVSRWMDQPFTTNSGYFYSEGGDYPVEVEYFENKWSAAIDVQFSKAQPYEEQVTSTGRWLAKVFHTDPWNPSNPNQTLPADFAEDQSRRIATIDLGSSTKSSGQKGINFNVGEGALKGNGEHLPHNNFAVRAYTQAQFDGGEYKFKVSGDDAFQLFAKRFDDGSNRWYSIQDGGRQMNSGAPDSWVTSYGQKEYTVTLPKGFYDLHFSFAEAGGDAIFDLTWEKIGGSSPNPGYTFRDADYLNALYQDNTNNYMGPNNHNYDHRIREAIDSSDKDAIKEVHALVGGEVIEAFNGVDIRSTFRRNPVLNDWKKNGTVAIYNQELNKTFIYWHFAAGSINQSLKGQTISAGSRIGIEGDTGYSFGSHTHVEIHNGRANINMAYGQAPANIGRLNVENVFQDAVRKGLVKLFQ